MRRRPNPHKSLKPGCAPMLTPSATASVTSRCIVTGSPAWNPQAMLAERMILSNPASSPMSYAPKPSPISALRLIALAMPPPRSIGHRRSRSLPGKRDESAFPLAPATAPSSSSLAIASTEALSERRAAPRCDHPFERAQPGRRDGPDLPLADGLLRSVGDQPGRARSARSEPCSIATAARAPARGCGMCRSAMKANSPPIWPRWRASPG